MESLSDQDSVFPFYSQEQQSTHRNPDPTQHRHTPDPDAATHPDQDHDKSLHPHPDQDNLNPHSHDAEHVSEDPDHVNLSSHSLDRGGVLGTADLVDGNPNYPSYEPGIDIQYVFYHFTFLFTKCMYFMFIKGPHLQQVIAINHSDQQKIIAHTLLN
jgi:hypothetical protein